MVQAIATSAYRKARPDSRIGKHLGSLEAMLWGGTLMLIVDHILAGELTWQFPFFTALSVEGGGAVMLREMLTVGVPMSLVITAVWAVYVYIKQRRVAV